MPALETDLVSILWLQDLPLAKDPSMVVLSAFDFPDWLKKL